MRILGVASPLPRLPTYGLHVNMDHLTYLGGGFYPSIIPDPSPQLYKRRLFGHSNLICIPRLTTIHRQLPFVPALKHTRSFRHLCSLSDRAVPCLLLSYSHSLLVPLSDSRSPPSVLDQLSRLTRMLSFGRH